MFMRLFLFLILGLIIPMPTEADVFRTGEEAILIVQSSPYAQYQSRLHLNQPDMIREVLEGERVRMEKIPELPLAFLELKRKNQTERYMISYSLNLFQTEKGIKIKIPRQTKDKLLSYIETLQKRHYGEPVSWKEARILFPRKGYADVIDMETGLQFRVQRRAGSQHADVQPLTAADTEIMKKIYNGKWSWDRRAILVRTDEGHILAASMHGMPHGGGAISWNNFPGHFCIHFKDSTTHRRSFPDPGHDLMISKASGELHDRIVHGSPNELISLLAAAVNEQDQSVIKLMLNQDQTEQVNQLLKALEKVESLSIQPLSNKGNEILSPFLRQISVRIELKKMGTKPETMVSSLTVTRGSLQERWKLELQPIVDLFL